jgi:hypothetical protein
MRSILRQASLARIERQRNPAADWRFKSALCCNASAAQIKKNLAVKSQICALGHIPHGGEDVSKTKGREDVMNHSMNSADLRTHLKIVVVGLLSATVVAVIASFAHVSDIDLGTAPIVKAGHSTAMSGRLPAIR